MKKLTMEEAWEKNRKDLARYNKFAILYAFIAITGAAISMYFHFIWGWILCFYLILSATINFSIIWRYSLDKERFEKDYKEASDIVDNLISLFSKRR